MTDTDAISQPVQNPAFAKSITWRVFNEEIYPAHTATSTVFTGRIVSGQIESEVPRTQTLSLAATIGRRQRFDEVDVTRAVLDSVSADRTYETKSARYPRRLILWGGVWIAAFALTWPALASLVMYPLIVLLAAIAVTAPLFAGAIVDFAWWAGRGFANESRTKWLLAAALWALDVVPLVFLQIRLL